MLFVFSPDKPKYNTSSTNFPLRSTDMCEKTVITVTLKTNINNSLYVDILKYFITFLNWFNSKNRLLTSAFLSVPDSSSEPSLHSPHLDLYL